MDSNLVQEQRPALTSYDALAGLIEHSLVRPDLSEEDVAAGCYTAVEYGLAGSWYAPAMSIWRCASRQALPCELSAWPVFPRIVEYGTKLYEGRDLLRRGVKEYASSPMSASCFPGSSIR